MDEDEEVDILGNYDDISKISSGQLLSCDYTVHPNWVNENAEGGNFWTDSVPKHENLESNVRVLQSEEVVIKEPEPVPSLIEIDWNRECHGQDDLIFEEDIPATIEEVVEEVAFNCVPSPPSNSDQCPNYDDQYYDGWELAAFETHPPAKNAKYIGPTNPRSLLKVKIESQTESNENDCNISKNNIKYTDKPLKKFKQTLTVSPAYLTTTSLPKHPLKSKMSTSSVKNENTKTKFKQTVKMPPNSFKNNKFKLSKKFGEPKILNKNTGKYKKHKRKGTVIFGENITINHELEQKERELAASETVVRLKLCDTDSDIEIDIESDSSTERSKLKTAIKKPTAVSKSLQVLGHISNSISKAVTLSSEPPKKGMCKELETKLKEISVPSEEFHINTLEITDLEKYVHSEFFENRITKTPEQYLRIRNHILSMWRSSKPNYISKTAVRSGLKQAGDVNCISRIHKLLEQIGAINFGHQGTYFDFIRPLEHFISTLVQPPRNRTNSNSSSSSMNPINIERRQRVRVNSSVNDSFSGQDGNYTISHMDGVVRPEPPILNVNRGKTRSYASHIKTELDLVKCLKFSKENIAPFKVSITLSTLLCLHMHSLSSDYEVMGFLGGHRSKSVGRNKISLTRYKPCRTSQQSGTMCEMCPVSQVEQSSSLQSEGFELLGWFHSHPLFPANPSRTDVQTQKEMQLQFSFDDRPLIGMILSCLNMSFKCMYVMPKDLHSNFNDNGLPYELDVDVIKDCTDFKNDVKDVLSIVTKNCDFPLDIVEKFKLSSNTILTQYGYNSDTFFEGVFS